MFAYSIMDGLSHSYFSQGSQFFYVIKCHASTKYCDLVGGREDVASVDRDGCAKCGQVIF